MVELPKFVAVSSGAILSSLGEDKIGFLPVYLRPSNGFNEIDRYFELIFDLSSHASEKGLILQNLKNNFAPLFNLESYEEHRKLGANYSYYYVDNPTGMSERWEKELIRVINPSSSLAKSTRFIRLPRDTSDKLSLVQPEGLTIRSLLANESVFLSEQKTVIVIGPEIERSVGGSLKPFKIGHSAENLNLSLDYLVRAGIVSERAGGKPIELLVVGTQGITEDDIRKRIDKIIGDGEEYSRLVGTALPNERHSALMGGVGLSAGYHRHAKNFIFNLRTGVDHIWGRFQQTGPQTMDTESVPRLGCGITLGAGVDYKFTEKSTIGLEGGLRFSEFKIPQQADPKTTKSSWFLVPYAQIVCGFYPTPDYSVSVFTGYFCPRTFSAKAEGTKITEGTQCKVDGIFGGLRFARYF